MNAEPRKSVFTLPEAAERAGMDYRAVHIWMKRGLITPSVRATEDTGDPTLFSEADVVRLSVLVRLRRAGLSISGLHGVTEDARPLRDTLNEWLELTGAGSIRRKPTLHEATIDPETGERRVYFTTERGIHSFTIKDCSDEVWSLLTNRQSHELESSEMTPTRLRAPS